MPTRKPDKKPNNTVRAVDADLKAEVRAFFEAAGVTRSVQDEADLVRKGIRYYLRDYKRANGIVGSDGFPVLPPSTTPKR